MGIRVAVLSDVHGNPWALRAALEDVRRVSVDLVVNCGDLVAGPWPTEVVEELLGCGLPVLSVRGNGDRMVADASDGRWDDVPPPARPTVAWAAARLRPEERRLVGAMPLTAEVDVQGLGAVACFHATPGSDEEILLPTSEEERVRELLAPLLTDVAVHGHSHLQDDRFVAGRRLVNAGSVGKPFDSRGAAWLLLGPGVELRRTDYDIAAAVDAARRELSGSTEGQAVAEDFAEAVQQPPGREQTLELFGRWESAQVGHLAARSRLSRLDG